VTAIDLVFAEGFALAPVSGTEAALAAASPAFAAGWSAVQAALPAATLEPLFAGVGGLTAEAISDLFDAARMVGETPPDLLRWFRIECSEELLETVVPLVAALPWVEWSGARPQAANALLRDGTVSWGTNPLSSSSQQLRRAPFGVDALHAWLVDGGTGLEVRIADLEAAWWLGHEDLAAARITAVDIAPTASEEEESHGTTVAGLIVGADDDRGTVGVVPDAQLLLFTVKRSHVDHDLAATIVRAAQAAGTGGVLLIENGFRLKPESDIPDELLETVPAETNYVVHQAIKFATALGVTVLEVAGNSGIDLGDPPEAPTFPSIDLSLPTRSDSGAIIVGSGAWVADPQGWVPASMTVHGARVDCFAQGARVFVASKLTPSHYEDDFHGTSAATAIVAGVVTAIQGMAKAHRGAPLAPRYIRDLLRDRTLGTPMLPGHGGVGHMPDLRRIARSQRWSRIVPVAAATVADDALVLVHLDDEDRLVRRHFSFWTGWGRGLRLVPTPGHVWPARPAVVSWAETATGRVVQAAFASGGDGLYQLAWDSAALENLSQASTSSGETIAAGKSPAVVLASANVIVVLGVGPDGRMVALSSDPLNESFSGPTVLVAGAGFRRSSGPAAVSASAGTVDAIAVSDDGALRWFHGQPSAVAPSGWSPAVATQTGQFVPGAGMAALAINGRVLVTAVGIEGWLYAVEINPIIGAVAAAISAPAVIDVETTFATQGPLALARLTTTQGERVFAFGVDTEERVRVAWRPAAGGAWSTFAVIASSVPASPLGGVVAVSPADLGMVLFVVGSDGQVRTTQSRDGIGWDPWVPVPDSGSNPQPWRRRGRDGESVLISELFAGDVLLESIVADAERISRTRNASAEAVRKVQQALLTWNPNCLPQWGADGNYGDETAAAVATFKRQLLGVPVAQIVDDVGPATVLRLDKIQAAAEGGLGTLTTLRFLDEYGNPLANLDVVVVNQEVTELLTTDAIGQATVHLAQQSGLEIDSASALNVIGNLTGQPWPPPGGFPPAHAVLTLGGPPLRINPGDKLDIVVATRVAVGATLVAPLAGNVRIEGSGAALATTADGQVTLQLQATGGAVATVFVDPAITVDALPSIPDPTGWTPIGTYAVRPGDTAEGLASAFVGDPNDYAALSGHPPIVGEVLTLPQVPGWLGLVTAPIPSTAPAPWFSVVPDAIVAAVVSAGDMQPLQDLLAVLDRPPAPDPDPVEVIAARAQAVASIIAQPGLPLGVEREPEEDA
jgi:peptidoglycan hydrolase-like protein with peptidoglycan-binding domain